MITRATQSHEALTTTMMLGDALHLQGTLHVYSWPKPWWNWAEWLHITWCARTYYKVTWSVLLVTVGHSSFFVACMVVAFLSDWACRVFPRTASSRFEEADARCTHIDLEGIIRTCKGNLGSCTCFAATCSQAINPVNVHCKALTIAAKDITKKHFTKVLFWCN